MWLEVQTTLVPQNDPSPFQLQAIPEVEQVPHNPQSMKQQTPFPQIPEAQLLSVPLGQDCPFAFFALQAPASQ